MNFSICRMVSPAIIPCHDAFSRLFRLMKPTSLQAFFDRFRSDFAAAHAEHPAIAIDGKEMRRSCDKAAAQLSGQSCEPEYCHCLCSWCAAKPWYDAKCKGRR